MSFFAEIVKDQEETADEGLTALLGLSCVLVALNLFLLGVHLALLRRVLTPPVFYVEYFDQAPVQHVERVSSHAMPRQSMRVELARFLASSFEEAELRSLVREVEPSAVVFLPGREASLAILAESIVETLVRRNALDATLFKVLCVLRPRRVGEIQAIWELTSPQQEEKVSVKKYSVPARLRI